MTLRTGLIVVALLLGACGGDGDSIAGTYECVFNEHNDAQPNVLELREDGTLTFTIHTRPDGNPFEDGPPPLEGTWSVEGDSGSFSIEGDDNPFTVEGDRLIFPPADGGGSVCTLES